MSLIAKPIFYLKQRF